MQSSKSYTTNHSLLLPGPLLLKLPAPLINLVPLGRQGLSVEILQILQKQQFTNTGVVLRVEGIKSGFRLLCIRTLGHMFPRLGIPTLELLKVN